MDNDNEDESGKQEGRRKRAKKKQVKTCLLFSSFVILSLPILYYRTLSSLLPAVFFFLSLVCFIFCLPSFFVRDDEHVVHASMWALWAEWNITGQTDQRINQSLPSYSLFSLFFFVCLFVFLSGLFVAIQDLFKISSQILCVSKQGEKTIETSTKQVGGCLIMLSPHLHCFSLSSSKSLIIPSSSPNQLIQWMASNDSNTPYHLTPFSFSLSSSKSLIIISSSSSFRSSTLIIIIIFSSSPSRPH